MKLNDHLTARPLPERVVAFSAHSVPFFNTGFHFWPIVDVANPTRTICQLAFPAADHKHRDYPTYMAARREEAQQLAEVINRGLEAMK